MGHAHRHIVTAGSGKFVLRRPKAKPYRKRRRAGAAARALVCLSSTEWLELKDAVEAAEVSKDLVDVMVCREVDTPADCQGKIHPPWHLGQD